MTFLKKLGMILAKGTEVATGVKLFFPKYETQIERGLDVVDEILSVVTTVEAIGAALALPGPDKLKAATPLIAQLVLRADQFKGKKIDNPVLFQEGIAKITNGFVDVLNSFDPAEIKQ